MISVNFWEKLLLVKPALFFKKQPSFQVLAHGGCRQNY